MKILGVQKYTTIFLSTDKGQYRVSSDGSASRYDHKEQGWIGIELRGSKNPDHQALLQAWQEGLAGPEYR